MSDTTRNHRGGRWKRLFAFTNAGKVPIGCCYAWVDMFLSGCTAGGCTNQVIRNGYRIVPRFAGEMGKAAGSRRSELYPFGPSQEKAV